MSEFKTPPENVSGRERIPINQWFHLFPKVPNKNMLVKRQISFTFNPLNARENSPFVVNSLPIAINATYLTGGRAYAGGIGVFGEFPLDPGLGYVIDRDDISLETRVRKWETLHEDWLEGELRSSSPSEFYWLGVEIDNDAVWEPFLQPDKDESGRHPISPHVQEFIRGVRFRIHAPGTGVYREATSENIENAPRWESFYSLEGPLPVPVSFDESEEGQEKYSLTTELTNGNRISFLPQHLQSWYGIFLAPGTQSIPFPALTELP